MDYPVAQGRFPRVLALMMTSVLLVSCGTYELESGWRDRDIVIDGKTSEWHGQLLYDEEDHISLGLMNDESDLYICVLVEHPVLQRQVMAQGLTIWFDPGGKIKKTFGIRYPLGMRALVDRGERAEEENPRKSRPEFPRGAGNPLQGGEEPERMQELFQRTTGQMEILFPNQGLEQRVSVDEVSGIQVAVEASSGMLVCELKVPLQRGSGASYGIQADAGSRIAIGWETPKPDRGDFGGRRPSGGRSGMGGRGGMGGMNPGMGGGMRPDMGGGMRPQMTGALKVWAHVQLAASDGNS